jgi:thiamine pyrophosphate-dependent acetolactate synthase large subunit-like protein
VARPDKTIVSVVGDGAFIFGHPIATYWAASVYKAPFLTIILDNEVYKATKKHLWSAYGRESYSEKTGWVGMEIKPSPDYVAISQASYAYAQRVTEPAQFKTALKQALEQVNRGKPAVLDVKISEETG